MRNIKTVTLIALILAIAIPALAQHPTIDRNQLYLLLAATETETMQRELDEASAQGFKVVMGSPTSTGEISLFLERSTQPPATFKYKLLSTTLTGTMEKELNQ